MIVFGRWYPQSWADPIDDVTCPLPHRRRREAGAACVADKTRPIEGDSDWRRPPPPDFGHARAAARTSSTTARAPSAAAVFSREDAQCCSVATRASLLNPSPPTASASSAGVRLRSARSGAASRGRGRLRGSEVATAAMALRRWRICNKTTSGRKGAPGRRKARWNAGQPPRAKKPRRPRATGRG